MKVLLTIPTEYEINWIDIKFYENPEEGEGTLGWAEHSGNGDVNFCNGQFTTQQDCEVGMGWRYQKFWREARWFKAMAQWKEFSPAVFYCYRNKIHNSTCLKKNNQGLKESWMWHLKSISKRANNESY